MVAAVAVDERENIDDQRKDLFFTIALMQLRRQSRGLLDDGEKADLRSMLSVL